MNEIKELEPITTDEALAPLLEALDQVTRIAIDTEADNRHHYQERICLIQIGTGDRQWLVDPLADLDLTPLMRRLTRLELVLHGGDFDLRLLRRYYRFRPRHIFDTMLAAQLLGREQWGLASLIEQEFDVVLSKACQKEDWSRRPLPEAFLQYAADDTRYLLDLADRMTRALREKDRLEWHRESCEKLIIATQSEPIHDREPWRIKGGKNLRGRSAAVLRELWQWRDELACQLDRPPFKVASNDLLLTYARWSEQTDEPVFEEAPERPAWLKGSRLRGFDKALRTALKLPPAKFPPPPRKSGNGHRGREDEELVKRLVGVRDEVARREVLDPGVVGPREALRTIARECPTSIMQFRKASPLMRWQDSLLMDGMLPILHENGAAKPSIEGSEAEEKAHKDK